MPAAAFRLYSRQSNHSVPFVRLPFDECRNIDEVLKLAINNIHNLQPTPTAAAWNFILRLLTTSKDQSRNCGVGQLVQGSEQLEQHVSALFLHTMNSLEKMKHKDLTSVILSMAKFVKNIREANQMKRMTVYHRALGSLLQQSNPFGHFATTADRKLVDFDARHVSNLAYAQHSMGLCKIEYAAWCSV
jgi:hypothetical protein